MAREQRIEIPARWVGGRSALQNVASHAAGLDPFHSNKDVVAPGKCPDEVGLVGDEARLPERMPLDGAGEAARKLDELFYVSLVLRAARAEVLDVVEVPDAKGGEFRRPHRVPLPVNPLQHLMNAAQTLGSWLLTHWEVLPKKRQ
jgi:hypothetical protein